MPTPLPVYKLDLLPLHHRETIIPDYIDQMGHMNVQFYLHLYTQAIAGFYASIGMTESYFRDDKGFFTLNHCITYYKEVLVADTVAIRSRILGHSAKRLHFMFFMVNETTNQLVSTLEVLDSHADLARRRTSPFPKTIEAQIRRRAAADRQLDWETPVCGVLKP